MICPYCKTPNVASNFCTNCGRQLPSAAAKPKFVVCDSCGQSLQAGKPFCVNCGARQPKRQDDIVPAAVVDQPNTGPPIKAPVPQPIQQPAPPPAYATGSPPDVPVETGFVDPVGPAEPFFGRLIRRGPLVLFTMGLTFATHFYLMAFVNDGYHNKTKWRNYKFAIPGVDQIQNESLRKSWLTVESSIGTVVNPIFPYTIAALNRKETSANYSFQNASIGRRLSHSVFTGNFNSSFTIWTSLSFLFWTLFGTAIRAGPTNAIGRIVAQPVRFFRMFIQRRPKDWGALLLGVSLGAIAGAILQLNTEASITTLLAGIFVIPTQTGRRIASLIYRFVPSQVKGLRSKSRFSLKTAHLIAIAFPVGIGLQAILFQNSGLFLGTLGLILGVALVFFPSARSMISTIGFGRIGLISIAILIFLGFSDWIDIAFADDGGPREFAGSRPNWQDTGNWIANDGGLEVGIHSATGTAGSGLGAGASGINDDKPPEESEQKNKITSVNISVSEAVLEE